MKNIIKKILKEDIGGNYFYLIVTKDGKYYLNDGDGFDIYDELFPMDGVLSYEELDRLHTPGKGGQRLYKTNNSAIDSLKSSQSFYDRTLNEPQWAESTGFGKGTDALLNQMEELGYTWDDFTVKEYYLGLVSTDNNFIK